MYDMVTITPQQVSTISLLTAKYGFNNVGIRALNVHGLITVHFQHAGRPIGFVIMPDGQWMPLDNEE